MKRYALLILAAAAAACNSSEEFVSARVSQPADRIVEYTPAPGQFINEPQSGFTDVTTPEAACAYAEQRIAQGAYVSLGGWGGTLVARFDEPLRRIVRAGRHPRHAGRKRRRTAQRHLV